MHRHTDMPFVYVCVSTAGRCIWGGGGRGCPFWSEKCVFDRFWELKPTPSLRSDLFLLVREVGDVWWVYTPTLWLEKKPDLASRWWHACNVNPPPPPLEKFLHMLLTAGFYMWVLLVITTTLKISLLTGHVNQTYFQWHSLKNFEGSQV